MHKRFILVSTLLFWAVCMVQPALGICPSVGAAMERIFACWDSLLEAHVHDGLVDYAEVKTDREKLDQYLAFLDSMDPAAMDRQEALAFYINLYNAASIRLIAEHYPGLGSIKDLGSWFTSPWELLVVPLEGEMVTLDHIEHEIIRPTFKDPRVHFALNCTALSCPPLLNQAYDPERLEEQLDQVTRAFLNDPTRTWLTGDTLHLSRIFKWFAEDFIDPVAFVRGYAEGDLKARLDALGGAVKVRYQEYDWSLNDLRARP